MSQAGAVHVSVHGEGECGDGGENGQMGFGVFGEAKSHLRLSRVCAHMQVCARM